MKVLITGGAGFIGSHLAESYIGSGDSVVVLDDLSTGSLDNLKTIENSDRFEFTQGSACDKKLVDELVGKCDAVFHLAAAVGVQLIVDRPVHTIETNIHGTESVLEASGRHKRKVLIASTSEVYGKSDNVPFAEDDDTVLGSTRFSRWSYACSKAIDEFLGFAYHQERSVQVVIARLFNTIGPRQVGRYGMVVPRFVDWALKGEDIMIYGNGKQTRCFCCVADVVKAITGLMGTDRTEGRVYNVGSSEEVSIRQLAEKIIQKTDSTSEIKYISYEKAYGKPFDDMLRRVPCLDRIGETIGYRPSMDLDKTLDIIIESRRELL